MGKESEVQKATELGFVYICFPRDTSPPSRARASGLFIRLWGSKAVVIWKWSKRDYGELFTAIHAI